MIKILLFVLIGLLQGVLFLADEKRESVPAKSLTPCESPLTYHFGEIDTRFGITEEEVKKVMKSASDLWSDALGRPLAVYDKDGAVVVHLIYDERKEMLDGEWRFREKIRTEQVLITHLKNDYENHRVQFEKRSEEYVQLVNKTNRSMNSLRISVNSAVQFRYRKNQVERLEKQVLSERKILDEKMEKMNRLLEELNRRIKEKRILMKQYKDNFAGESRFAKANFQRIDDGGVITVNQFMNKKELLFLLAHELGHALGLDHVPNPRSVMHGQMRGQQIDPTIQLTNEDRDAIRNRCR